VEPQLPFPPAFKATKQTTTPSRPDGYHILDASLRPAPPRDIQNKNGKCKT